MEENILMNLNSHLMIKILIHELRKQFLKNFF